MTHSPARVAAQLVIDLGHGVEPDVRDPQPWSVYSTGEPPSPDEVISVRGTAGRDEEATSVDMELQQWHGLQVRLRSMGDDGFGRLFALSEDLNETNERVVTVGQVQYLVHSMVQVGPVAPLNKADSVSQRSVFVTNFDCSISQLPQA